MTPEEFIKQQIDSGHKVHYSKNVWWEKMAPFYYKPAMVFKEIEPGESRPRILRFYLKYSHVVRNIEASNKRWPVMLLTTGKLNEFSLKSLSSSKRSQVRKGLKFNEIKKITDIESVVDNIRDICISTAKRTNHGKPPSYYLKEYDSWRSWLLKEFSLPFREWWGAYYKETLIAYIYAVPINDTTFIYTAKSHTDHLDKCPNDALIYTFLDYCRGIDSCKQIIYGDWAKDAESLNKFKEKFGFEKREVPMYEWLNPVIKLFCKFIKIPA